MESIDASSDNASIDAIVALVERSTPACGAVTVVAIDGPSGAGKSTLSAGLGDRIGAAVVHLDDIYPGWEGLPQAAPLVTTEILEPLSRGEDAAYRRWDWDEDRWAETVPVPYTTLLVLEGCGSSVRPAGDFAAVRVWVEAARDVRFERGITRDGEAYRPLWEMWAKQEVDLFTADGTRARADIVIDTTGVRPWSPMT